MKRTTYLTILLVLTAATNAIAQTKTKTTTQQVWAGYFNQTRLSKRWGFWAEGQLRTKERFFSQFSQSILRGGITYYLGDNTKFTLGDAYVSIYPADNHSKVTQPEHRPWQQLQWHTTYSRVRTMQWFRLEERFRRKILNDSTLADGNNFNFRARYNFLLQVPLTKDKIKAGDFSFIINDEVHVNFGKQIVYNSFDQNRAFVGFAYHTNSRDYLQFGYMNIWQQLADGSTYRTTHTARVFYFHNLDLRKKL